MVAALGSWFKWVVSSVFWVHPAINPFVSSSVPSKSEFIYIYIYIEVEKYKYSERDIAMYEIRTAYMMKVQH